MKFSANNRALTPSVLNYLVALCQEVEIDENHEPIWFEDHPQANMAKRIPYEPVTNWQQGGKIIQEMKIDIQCDAPATSDWVAKIHDDCFDVVAHKDGATPLEAAMRCLIEFKLGSEFDIPSAVFERAAKPASMLRTFTVLVREVGIQGSTTYISSCEAANKDEAAELGRKMAANAWGCSAEDDKFENIQAIGVLEGDVNVLLWNDNNI